MCSLSYQVAIHDFTERGLTLVEDPDLARWGWFWYSVAIVVEYRPLLPGSLPDEDTLLLRLLDRWIEILQRLSIRSGYRCPTRLTGLNLTFGLSVSN